MMVLSVLYKQTLCAMKSRIVEEVGMDIAATIAGGLKRERGFLTSFTQEDAEPTIFEDSTF